MPDPYGKDNYLQGADKPPYPDDVAQRGTPEWRAAFDKMQDWIAKSVAAKGGAGDNAKTRKILEDLGFRNVKELGKANFSRSEEIAKNAASQLQQSQARQWWAGGNGRALTPEEMASFEAVTGVAGKPNGNDPRLLKKWADAGGLKSNPSAVSEGGSVGSGGVDMWPGATGQEGSLPSYAAPQYNPVDSWGGWSGVYGNNTGAPANPAGLGQAPLAMPASSSGLGNPANITPATGGLQAPAALPLSSASTMNTGYDGSGINPQAQAQSKPVTNQSRVLSGYNGSGINPTMGQSMIRPNRKRNTGVSGLGAPTTLGVVPG